MPTRQPTNMLTQLQKVTFRLHSRAFFALYPIPVAWDETYSCLLLSPSILAWLPWLATLLCISAFGVASLFTPIMCTFFRPEWRVDKVQSTIITLTGLCIMIMTIITITTFKNLRAIISAVNEEMGICEKLTRDYPGTRPSSAIWHEQLRDRFTDRYGLVLLIIVFCGGTAPIALTFGSLYTNYDVTFLILELVLTNPMDRELNEILSALAIRTFVIFYFTLEGARTITFFGCCALCSIDHGAKIIQILMMRATNFQLFLYIYSELRLLFSKVRDWIYVVIYLALGVLFWCTVGCCWCCVKCYGKVPWPFYYAAMFSAISFIFGHLVVLPPSVKAAEMCVQVVESHYKRARLNYAKCKTRQAQISLRQGLACAPIKFKYGMFWVIGKRFVVDYFCLLMLRTFDLILIVNF